MTPPTTIAHYRITSKLGEGGMGSPTASDTKLNRDDAIKGGHWPMRAGEYPMQIVSRCSATRRERSGLEHAARDSRQCRRG
jgi:hypothetical protein